MNAILRAVVALWGQLVVENQALVTEVELVRYVADNAQFINMISNSELEMGHGLRSCTASVGRSQPFEFLGKHVTLIDTPGFDDTTVSDTDILKMIALYLSTT